MRAIALVVLIALLPAAPAFAQNKPATHPKPGPLPKAEPAKRAKACADYGAGFVQVGETGSCVKIGGYVRMQGSAR
jgi:hypothetical protein